MAPNEQRALSPQQTVKRLLLVFMTGAVAVFGLLFQQMWTHARGFDAYAFEYWGPRALVVVLVTTVLGLVVVNQSWKARSLFGFFGGLFVSFFYIWITN